LAEFRGPAGFYTFPILDKILGRRSSGDFHGCPIMLSLTTRTRTPAAVLAILTALSLGSAFAQDASVSLSPAALREIAQVEVDIDRIEAQALERLSAPPDNQVQQIELLGKAMLYDKQLSVNRNEACAFCHMPQTGFTGPVSELNATTGSYPGSVRTRFSDRKPQTHSYAPLSPCPAFQSGARRLGRRQFLGHARHWPPPREPCGRAGAGTLRQPGGNGPSGPHLCRLSRLPAALSRII
jgi:hypothetical protein